MAPSARTKNALKRLKSALNTKYEVSLPTPTAGAVGAGKIYIGGQLFDGDIAGTTQVVNVGRPAAAAYVPKFGGGGTTIISSGSSSGSVVPGVVPGVGTGAHVLKTGDIMTGALFMDADTSTTSNYIRWLTQTATGRSWDLTGRAHDYSIAGQQNDLLLTYFDGTTIFTAFQADSVTRIIDFGQTPTVGGTPVVLTTRTVTAGAGLTGGGALSANITLTAVAPATLSVSSANNAAAHTHAITSSSAPGAAASLLASSAAGNLTLPTLTATTSITTPSILSTGDLTITPTGGDVFVVGRMDLTGRLLGGMGAQLTTGTLDWNDTSNARSGNGFSLMRGSDSSNAPTGAPTNAYYHPFNFEYNTKDGSGNITQLAIPYSTTAALDAGIYMRGRYLGTWSNWAKIISANTAGNVLIGTNTDAGYKFDVTGTARVTTSLTTPLITTASNVDLVINPAGTGAVQFPNDQKLRTSSFDSAFPITGWQINEVTGISGKSALTIGSISADELFIKYFVADETRIRRGQQYWTYSNGIVSRDFTTPSAIAGTARVYFENSPAITGAIFVNSDWLMFQYIDNSGGGFILTQIWGQVSSYVDEGDGEQSWLFTLRNGLTSTGLKKGTEAIDFGASGAALIQLSVVDVAGSPYIKMRRWSGANPYTPSNHKTYVQLGDLGSIGNSYVTPAGDGIYIASTAGDDQFIVADNNGLQIRGASLALYNGANQTVNLSYTGMDVWVGTSSSDKRLQWNGTSLNLNNSAGAAVITLDNSGASYFAGPMTIGTSGGIYQGTGTFASPTTGLKIWNDTGIGRIAGYNTGVLQWYASTTGKLYAGAGAVWMDAAGINIAVDAVGTPDYIRFDDGGTTRGSIGLLRSAGPTPGANDGMIFYNNETTKFRFLGASSTEFDHGINITGHITVSGLVDSVDIAAFKTAYDSHSHSGVYLPLSGGTLTGTLTSRTIAPSANNTYEIGSSSNYYLNGYIRNLYTDTIVGTPSFSHTHDATDIISGTLDDARLPTTMAGKTFSSGVIIDTDTGTTSNYVRWLTQTATGKAWDLTGRAHDYATTPSQQNDLLLTYYDGSTIYTAFQADSATRVIDFGQTPTVGGTAVSLSTHNHDAAYVPLARTVTAGSGMTGGGALSSNITISHADTSSQASVDNSGVNFIQDITLDAYGHVTAIGTASVATALGTLYLGATSTGGTLDWNDVSNTRPNSGFSLMRGSDSTNEPTGAPSSVYFHPINFEYNTKDGSGNITQLAIPYSTTVSLDAGIYMRGRYLGTWSNWAKIISENTSGNVLIGSNADSGYKLSVTGTVRSTGNIYAGADIEMTGELLAASGTAGAPSIAALSDTNTGLYWSAADTLAVTTGGTLRLSVSTAAVTSTLPVLLPDGTLGAPALAFSADTDSGIYRSSSNTWYLVAGGTGTMAVTSTGVVVVGTLSSTGAATLASDTDTAHSLGRVRLGYAVGTDTASFSHVDRTTSTDYALSQSQVGATILNAASAQTVSIALDGTPQWTINSDRLLPRGDSLIDIGDYNRKIRSLYLTELKTQTLIATEYYATIGGDLIVAPTTKLIAAISAATGAPGQSSLYTTMIAYWTFNEAAAGTRTDSKGANDLSGASVSYTTGKLGNAGLFGGTNSAGATDNGELSVGDNDWYFSCWIYPTNDNGNLQCIAAKGTPAGSRAWALRVAFHADNYVYLDVWNAGQTQTTFVGASTFGALSINTWYFVECWHNATSNTIGVAVNRTENTTAFTYGTADDTGPFTVGQFDSSEGFIGRIDEVGFWKSAIPNSTDRNFLYNSGTGKTFDDIYQYGAADINVDVEHNNLRSGEYFIMKTAPGGVQQFERFKTTSGASSITGGYRYTAQRDFDGTGSNNWTVGDAVVSEQKNAGEGYLWLTSTASEYGHNGPGLIGYVRTGTNAADIKPAFVTGNLRSFIDYATDEFGSAAGNDLTLTPTTGFKGYAIDRTAGLRLFNADIKLYNAGTQTVNIDNAGTDVWIGPSSASKRLYWNGTTLAIVGSITVSSGSSGYANLTDKPTTLSGINADEGTKLNAGLDVNGYLITKVLPGSTVGTPSGSGLFLGSDKMGYYNGSRWLTYIDNTGAFTFSSATSAKLAWDGTDLYGTDGTTVQWYARASTGKLYAGAGAVTLDSVGLTALISSTPTIRLNGTYGLDILMPSVEGSVQAITWRDTLNSGTADAKVDAWIQGDNTSMMLEVNTNNASPGGIITMRAENSSGDQAEMFLTSLVNGSRLASIFVDTFTVNGDIDMQSNDIVDISNLSIGTASTTYAMQVYGSPSVRAVLGYVDNASGYGEYGFLDSTSGNLKWAIGAQSDSASPANMFYIFQYRNSAETAVNAYRFAISDTGNVGIGGAGSFGGGTGVVFIANATAPSSNPSGGGILYAEGGAGKWRGSSGTVSTFGTAEPHCPVCGADYMKEFDNKEFGYFAICMKCLADELGNRPWILRGKTRLPM